MITKNWVSILKINGLGSLLQTSGRKSSSLGHMRKIEHMKAIGFRCRRRLFFAVACVLVLVVFFGAANSQMTSLPRVGKIKNYELATKNMTDGCGHHIVNLVRGYKWPGRTILLSMNTGESTWMNLNGRDVELILVKTQVKKREPLSYAQREYRAGSYRITVSYQVAMEYISNYPVTIRISNGKISRTIHAVGQAQCD
jgi:hypothetical protein